MTKRIFLDRNGLKISKPGFDVTTATPVQLTMNSGSFKLFSILLQQSVDVNNFIVDINTITAGSGGYTGHYESHYTISFGLTLASPPICFVTAQDPLLTDGTAVSNGFQYGQVNTDYYGDQGGTVTTTTGGATRLSFVVTTTDITLKLARFFSGFTIPPLPQFVNCSVLRTS